jgi:RecB family exonuclease
MIAGMAGAPHPLTAWLVGQLGDGGDTIVVTSSALAAGAQRSAVLREIDALAGVEFVAARGLAEATLRRCGAPWPLAAADPLEEREALRALIEPRAGPLARYAARFPAAARALLATIKELERAGWPRPAGESSARIDEVLALGERLRAHPVWRERASRSTLLGGAVAALERAPRAVRGWRVCVAGWFEPDGDVAALLEALERHGAVVAHGPVPKGAPAHRELRTCADPAAELRAAAAACLEPAAGGMAFGELVVAAPSLGPYAPFVRSAFAAEGIPVRTPAESALLREPRAAFVLHLARLLFDDAPRTSWVAVAAAPLLRHPLAPDDVHALEKRSREHVLAGRGDLAQASLAHVGRARKRLGALLRALLRDAQATPDDAPIPARLALLEAVADRLLAPPDGERELAVHERLTDVLRALSHAAAGPIDGARFVRELEDLLRTRGLPIADGGGVYLVEYRDAAAFPARRLHLLGLSSEQVPGTAPASHFLTDAERRLLPGLGDRAATRARAERELLRLLACPTDALALSRPRTAAGGAPLAPSFWLPKIAERLGALPESVHEPTHPLARAAHRVASGCCPRDQALLHLALGGAEPAAIAAAAGGDAARILAASARLERFDSNDLTRDGAIGAELGRALLGQRLPVGALERLGACPQQFLFEQGLGVRALAAEPDPVALPGNRVGSLVHRVLQRLYDGLRTEIAAGASPALLLAPAQSHAAELVREELTREAPHVRAKFPAYFALRARQWAEAIGGLLAFDLQRLAHDRARIVAVEREIEGELSVARPGHDALALALKGRIDRVDRLRDGRLRIIDYKTGAAPRAAVDASDVLRGRKLQLPVYAMLLADGGDGEAGEIEVLAVRAAANEPEPAHSVPLDDAQRWLRGDLRPALDETLAILAGIVAAGALSAAPEPDTCRRCDYRRACRRLHPPSLERVRTGTELAWHGYRALRTKKIGEPLLAVPEVRP